MQTLKHVLAAAGVAFTAQAAVAAALFLLLGELGLLITLGTWPVVFGPAFLTALICIDVPTKETS